MADEGYLLLKAAADMQKRVYTANEMRDEAAWLDTQEHKRSMKQAAMLRQAAEAMDRHTLPGVPIYPMPICGCTGPCGNVACPHMMKVTA